LKASSAGDAECVKVLKYGGSMITSLAFGGDGNILFSTALDCSVTGWDMKKLEVLEKFENVHRGNINCSYWQGKRLFTGGNDGCIKAMDLSK